MALLPNLTALLDKISGSHVSEDVDVGFLRSSTVWSFMHMLAATYKSTEHYYPQDPHPHFYKSKTMSHELYNITVTRIISDCKICLKQSVALKLPPLLIQHAR